MAGQECGENHKGVGWRECEKKKTGVTKGDKSKVAMEADTTDMPELADINSGDEADVTDETATVTDKTETDGETVTPVANAAKPCIFEIDLYEKHSARTAGAPRVCAEGG